MKQTSSYLDPMCKILEDAKISRNIQLQNHHNELASWLMLVIKYIIFRQVWLLLNHEEYYSKTYLFLPATNSGYFTSKLAKVSDDQND